MKNRLESFLNSKNFFSGNQFGFTKGKSTEAAINSFVEGVLVSINRNSKTTGIFIDYSKAFDLVDHNLLLEKLKVSGVREPALSWFKSFLYGRTQQVKIQNSVSDPKPISIGVPQGSVLSATLFVIFINDLLFVPFNGKVTAFADDVALQYVDQSWRGIQNKIKSDLTLLKLWCYNNKMVINVDKTKLINFSLQHFSFDDNFIFHNYNCKDNHTDCDCPIIEQVSQIKYLGVIIDESLSWKPHTTQLQLQTRKSIRQFYFLRNILSEHFMRILYFALIHSRLIYGIELWGGAHNNVLNPLEITQKHFVRILTFKAKREPSLPLFQSLKILPLKYLFIYKVLKVFYVRSGNDEVRQFNYYTRAATQRIYIRPKVKKIVFRKSFVFLGPKIFNILPNYIKTAKNSKIFQNKVKDWLFSKHDISTLLEVIV